MAAGVCTLIGQMAVRLVVTFDCLPGRGEAFVRAWDGRLQEVRTEPGCDQYELFRGTERPDTVVLLETWSSRQTMDEHGKVNATRTPVGRDLLSGPPTVERYES